MSKLIVCPLSCVASACKEHRPSHVVSLLGPEAPPPCGDDIGHCNHLHLAFNDVTAPENGAVAPSAEHMAELIDFIRRWDHERTMLIHCWAGISRSTAAAYTALCLHRLEDDEARLAAMLRKASPSATPNALMVALADELLGREGRMIEAINAIGRGSDAWEGNVFALPCIDPKPGVKDRRRETTTSRARGRGHRSGRAADRAPRSP